MLNTVLEDLEAEVLRWKMVIAVVLALVIVFYAGRCSAAKAAVIQEKVATLTHEVKVLTPVYVHDTVIAHRTKVVYDSLTPLIAMTVHDTVWVPKAIADTAINACTQALHDCDHLRVMNDSLLALTKQQKAGFKDRIGVFVGPTVTYTGGQFKAGIGVGAGIRIYP